MTHAIVWTPEHYRYTINMVADYFPFPSDMEAEEFDRTLMQLHTLHTFAIL